MSDTNNSYEIKDLDVKSVSTAINNCLVLLSDEELDSMSNFLSSESNDIKPDFLKVTIADIEDTLKISWFSPSNRPKKVDYNQKFYSEAKTTISNGFSNLRATIEKINNAIITWNSILDEDAEINDELEEVNSPEGELPVENKIVVDEDIVGVTDTGSKITIPAGEYDYGDIKTINGKTYIKVVINGVEYWVLFNDGAFVPYLASLIDTNITVTSSIVGLTLLGGTINIPPGDYRIHDAKDIDGKTYIQIEVNGDTVWVLFEDGKIIPYTGSSVTPTVVVQSSVVGITDTGDQITIPSGTYEILGTKTIDGKTYVKISINGIEYWVLYQDGVIVPYTGSSVASTIVVTSSIVGITDTGDQITIPAGTYEILGTKTIDGKTYIQISINGVTYWVLYQDGIVPYSENEERESYNGDFTNTFVTIYVNNKPIKLESGTYTIITSFEDNGKTYAVILYNGKYYIVLLDEDGGIVDGSDATIANGVYTILNTDITININGEEVNIQAGKYQIIAIKEMNGNRYGLILIDGKYYWVLIDENNNIVANSEGEPIEKPTIIITNDLTVIIDGEPITITPGKYTIFDIKTINGKRYALLLIDGKYYWILIDDNNTIVPNGEGIKVDSIIITIDNDLIIIVDGEPITITPGEYTILAIQEIDGKKYGLMLINGKYYWVLLDDNNHIVPNGETIPYEALTFDWDTELIFIINGETIIVKPGTYTIIRVIHYDDGSYAYYVLIDGKYYWFHFDKDGNFKFAYIEIPGNGVYTIDNELEIIDELGHVVGMTDQTTYHIYAIIYDADGNIVAIRISPPGEPERWIYVRSKGKEEGTYTPIEEDPKKSGDSVKYSHFKDHKLVLGCLLGLATVIGGAIVYKKKKGSKEIEDEYELEDGEYPVFEEDYDEDGSVSLRINNDSSDDDYWMEVR